MWRLRRRAARPEPAEPGLELSAGRPRGPVVFAATRVAGPRSRSSLWTGVLAGVAALALVALGVAGRVASSSASVSASPGAPGVAAATFADDVSAATIPPMPELGPTPVDFLVSRSSGGVEVSGTIGLHAVSILGVELTDAAGTVERHATLSVDDPDGGIRPNVTRTFHVTFPVPAGTTSPPTWIEVIAYDGVGAQIGAMTIALIPGSVLVKAPLKVNQTFVR